MHAQTRYKNVSKCYSILISLFKVQIWIAFWFVFLLSSQPKSAFDGVFLWFYPEALR